MPRLLSQPTTVLVTGTTSGVGAAVARQLLSAGHRVIAIARRADQAQEAPGLIPYACDLADPQATVALMAQIVATNPELTVVINNAGIQLPLRLDDPALDPAALERELAVNLLAPAIVARAVLPRFSASTEPTAIVNVTSGLAFHPKTTTALYCASKAGLHSLTQSLRYQCAGTRIQVSEAILPLVDTPMTAGRGSGKLSPKATAAAILSGIEQGRDEIYIGKARLIPILNRLAPAIPRAMLRNS